MPMGANKEDASHPKINKLKKKNCVLFGQWPGTGTAELSWPLQNGHTSATVHPNNVDTSLSTFLLTYP